MFLALPLNYLQIEAMANLENGFEQLCKLCAGMNVESLSQPEGYLHAATIATIRKNNDQCRMCKLILEAFGTPEDEDVSSLHCRLIRQEKTTAILSITSDLPKKACYVHVFTTESRLFIP